MAHISTVEGQLREIFKELLRYGWNRWRKDGPEYRRKLLSHFHLLELNVLDVRFILGCDETTSHYIKMDSLLEIRPDDEGLILHSGYKIYVPLLQAAVESVDRDKISKLLEMMDKIFELELLSLWFVACLAAKRKREDLVTFALDKALVVKEKNNVENSHNTGEDKAKVEKIQYHLPPWRYTVLCFLVENNFSIVNNNDPSISYGATGSIRSEATTRLKAKETTSLQIRTFERFDKYKYLFFENGNLKWVLDYMAAFGSTENFTNYIIHHGQINYIYDYIYVWSRMDVAIYHDNANFVKQFLQYYPKFRADINWLIQADINRLIQYAAMRDSTFTIKQLLEFQRDYIESRSDGDDTAKFITALLLQLLRRLNFPTTLTPLQLAALNGHAKIIKILRDEGKQEPNKKCETEGETEGETKSMQLLWPERILFSYASYELEKIDDWMPGSSLDPGECDPTQVLQRTSVWHPAGFTALHFAVVFRGTECVRALLEPPNLEAAGHGGSEKEWSIDVCAEDAEGLSPYDWAIAVDERMRNGNKEMQECLKPYVGLCRRPNSRSNEEMRRDKARALYRRARKSYKERKRAEWVDSMSMALFRRNWDKARYLAESVVSMDGGILMMDEESLDDDGAMLMLQAMEAARKTIFEDYEILSHGGKKFSYTLLPNKIAAQEVLRELLRRLIKRDPKVDVSQTAPECLSLAMKYGMEELAVDLVTLANCDVLPNGHFQVATDHHAMPRLLMAMEQRTDVRKALYEERQVYVDYANTLLVGAALISSLAYQGWLQQPMSYGEDHEMIMDERCYFMLAFTYTNNYGFTFSMGTMLAAAIGAIPLPTGQLAHTKKGILCAVLCASIFLSCFVTCVVVAFTSAESTVLSHHYVPPYRNYFIFNIAFTFVLLLWFLRRLDLLSFNMLALSFNLLRNVFDCIINCIRHIVSFSLLKAKLVKVFFLQLTSRGFEWYHVALGRS